MRADDKGLRRGTYYRIEVEGPDGWVPLQSNVPNDAEAELAHDQWSRFYWAHRVRTVRCVRDDFLVKVTHAHRTKP